MSGEGSIESRLGIEYGPLAAHKLDIFVPQIPREQRADSHLPLVVFVHGGAWRS